MSNQDRMSDHRFNVGTSEGARAYINLKSR